MPEAFAIGPFLFPTRPTSIVLSLLIAIWVSGRIANYAKLDVAWTRSVAETTAWLGVIGARFGFVVTNWSAFQDAPWTALYFWQPGYSPYAGVALGAAYALWRLSQRSSAQRWSYLRVLGSSYGLGAILLVSTALSMDALKRPGILSRGDRVPDFTLQTLDGRKVSFSSLQGRAVVLNFWATWCPPCRREMPLLDAIHQEFESHGLSVVGVNLGEPVPTVRAYVGSTGVTFPIWVDPPPNQPGYDRSGKVYERFGGVGLPTTFFIDPDGVLQGGRVGELNRAILQNRAEDMLSGRR